MNTWEVTKKNGKRERITAEFLQIDTLVSCSVVAVFKTEKKVIAAFWNYRQINFLKEVLK